MDPEEVGYLVEQLASLVPAESEALLSFMTDGDLLAVPLAQRIKKPLIVARDHHYNLVDRLSFVQRTGYFRRQLYVERPRRGQKLCLVDAIISKGGTMIAAACALRGVGCEVNGVVAAIGKSDENGLNRIRSELALEPRVIWTVGVKNNHLAIEKAQR